MIIYKENMHMILSSRKHAAIVIQVTFTIILGIGVIIHAQTLAETNYKKGYTYKEK